MRRKTLIALTTVLVAAASGVGVALIDNSVSKPAPKPKDYTVVDHNKPLDDQTDGLDDLEEPTIDGPTPRSAKDFVDDSKPGPETGPEELTPLGPAVTQQEGGWTATGPAN
ncbi:hypothetical protein [Nocardia brasiliensis]|uniref:hypothetical protein n=1 Tax=Nocardia brasiliensis TaxID=37326 RepID=UPI000A3DBC0A|nr:hypothetical protein [Nocardia brasiliensis]